MADLVLIDDDMLIHGAWSMVARSKNHVLRCFFDVDSFLGDAISRDTPVYVDYHFSRGENGVEVCKKLIAQGYQNIYIATGSVEHISDHPAEIKAVVGKDYPL